MKIAFLSVFYPFRGGIAQSNAQIYRAFERQGHTLKAWNFTTQYPSLLFPGTTQFVEAGDQADPIPNERTLSSINPLTFGPTIKKIRAFAPDLLVLRFWMPFFAPSLGYVAGKLRQTGTKVIAVIDNLIPHEKRPGDAQLTQYFLKRCDGFVVMSDVVERDLQSIYPKADYLFHPHPLYDQFGAKMEKISALTQLNLPSNQRTILYFGLIRKYKGLDILIEAFDQLDKQYELLIVGEPYGDFSPYQQLIDKNRNRDRIHSVIRYVADDEVPLYFSAADVCVLPYRSATQSGVIAIAYHFDLPVIVTDVGGLKGTVKPYGAGIIVDKAEAKPFAQAIKSYFDRAQQAPMSQAIQNFKQQYTWDGMATAIIKQFVAPDLNN
jgi:glycosyltransferase involved in cell wall biosynthesis